MKTDTVIPIWASYKPKPDNKRPFNGLPIPEALKPAVEHRANGRLLDEMI